MNIFNSMKSLTLGILMLCLNPAFKTDKQKIISKNIPMKYGLLAQQPIFKVVDHYAEFPGGMDKFYQYLSKRLHLTSNDSFGRIICRFVIEPNGKIDEVKIVKGLGKNIDALVIRIIKNSPEWQPGILNGLAVRQEFTLPIMIEPQQS